MAQVEQSRPAATRALLLPPLQRAVILKHLEAAKPSEGCGYFIVEDDALVEVVTADNVSPSPWKYELDIERMGEAVVRQESGEQVGLFHSHPYSPARPSHIDMTYGYVGWLYLIVGLAGPAPEFRCYRVGEDGWQSVVTNEHKLARPASGG